MLPLRPKRFLGNGVSLAVCVRKSTVFNKSVNISTDEAIICTRSKKKNFLYEFFGSIIYRTIDGFEKHENGSWLNSYLLQMYCNFKGRKVVLAT